MADVLAEKAPDFEIDPDAADLVDMYYRDQSLRESSRETGGLLPITDNQESSVIIRSPSTMKNSLSGKKAGREHPSHPLPSNWDEMTSRQRQKWKKKQMATETPSKNAQAFTEARSMGSFKKTPANKKYAPIPIPVQGAPVTMVVSSPDTRKTKGADSDPPVSKKAKVWRYEFHGRR